MTARSLPWLALTALAIAVPGGGLALAAWTYYQHNPREGLEMLETALVVVFVAAAIMVPAIGLTTIPALLIYGRADNA